jgi:hypothetical protein
MTRQSAEERLLEALRMVATYITWLLVVVVPIGVGVAVHRHFPTAWAPVPWLCGLAVLGLLFTCAELLWRGIRWLLTAGKMR